MGNNNGIIWWLSVLAALQSLSAASVWADWLPLKVLGAFTALVAAMTQGTAVWVAIKRPFLPPEVRAQVKVG